jgi:hypothetical protein
LTEPKSENDTANAIVVKIKAKMVMAAEIKYPVHAERSAMITAIPQRPAEIGIKIRALVVLSTEDNLTTDSSSV